MLNYSQIKLKDIAQATGYSVNTISRALRDMPDIAEETKKIISEKAKKMGYVPNKSAASLRTRKSMTIGVVFPSSNYPLFPYLLTELTFAASASGYSLLFFQVQEEAQPSSEITAACEHGLDGMIIISSYTWLEKAAETLTALSIPFVFLDEPPESVSCDTVSIDNEASTYQLTNYLLSKGHRDIVYVAGADDSIFHFQRRLLGFRRAMEEAGIPESQQHVVSPRSPLQDHVWLDVCTELYPGASAYIAYNDMIAMLLMVHFLRQGKRIPEDISIAGFDNILSSLWPFKLLTTVSIDLRSIAIDAIGILVKKIKGDIPLSEIFHRLTNATIVEGGTVRTIPSDPLHTTPD